MPVADGAKGNAVQPLVELDQVHVCQAAVVFHIHSNLKADVVHRTQHAAIAGASEADHAASLQHPFDLCFGKLIPYQRLEQTLAEDLIQLLKLQFSQARNEHRIQGRVVRKQHTLAPIKPQQVGVPAYAGSRRFNEAGRDFRQQLLRTMDQERHRVGFIPCDGSVVRNGLSFGAICLRYCAILGLNNINLHKEAAAVDIIDYIRRLLYDISEYLRINQRDGHRLIQRIVVPIDFRERKDTRTRIVPSPLTRKPAQHNRVWKGL